MPDKTPSPRYALSPRRLALTFVLVAVGALPMLLQIFGGFFAEYWPQYLASLLPLTFVALAAFVVLGLSDDAWDHAAKTALARAPHLFFHLFFVLVFLADVWFLVQFLLFPWTLVSESVHIKLMLEVQLLGCIGTAGFLGGFVRQLHTTLKPLELSSTDSQSSLYVRFFSTLYSLFSSVFIATVLFTLLRAGVLKTVELDTFNVYGVTGVSAISGYFADNIMSRLTHLYRELFGVQRESTTE